MSWTLISAAILVTAVLLWDMVARREEMAAFRKRFPPISDTEFLARCSPGTRPEVALRVRRLMAEELGVEYERVYPSSRLIEDLGAG